MIVRALLQKLQTDNGFMKVVPGMGDIGKSYWVDTESIRQDAFRNKKKEQLPNYSTMYVFLFILPSAGGV